MLFCYVFRSVPPIFLVLPRGRLWWQQRTLSSLSLAHFLSLSLPERGSGRVGWEQGRLGGGREREGGGGDRWPKAVESSSPRPCFLYTDNSDKAGQTDGCAMLLMLLLQMKRYYRFLWKKLKELYVSLPSFAGLFNCHAYYKTKCIYFSVLIWYILVFSFIKFSRLTLSNNADRKLFFNRHNLISKNTWLDRHSQPFSGKRLLFTLY